MMTTLKVIKGKTFLEGLLEDTYVTDTFSVALKDGKLGGKFVTPVMSVDAFKGAVVSWNAETSMTSSVEVQIRVGHGSKVSRWYSYGLWTRGRRASEKDQIDDFGELNIDDLFIKTVADTVQLQVILRRKDLSSEVPKLHFLSVTLDPVKTMAHTSDFKALRINVPQISQMLVTDIGDQICSPTSMTMLMNYYGKNEDEVVSADECYDFETEIYGNWSFNMAYAGELGYEAYVEHCTSLRMVYDYLKQGIPVAASIKTTKEDPIPGSPQGYPSGHLLVVKGFEWQNGEPYILVNDPASKTLDEVERLYPIDAFEKAWSNIIYVIKQRE